MNLPSFVPPSAKAPRWNIWGYERVPVEESQLLGEIEAMERKLITLRQHIELCALAIQLEVCAKDDTPDPDAATESSQISEHIGKLLKERDDLRPIHLDRCAKYTRMRASRINSATPINRLLPAELLARIFYLAASDDSTPDLESFWIPGHTVIKHCLRVCWLWRNVAFAHPDVFSFIAYTGFGEMGQCWMGAWIKRSKSAKLRVSLEVRSRETMNRLIRILFPHISRFQRLHFRCHSTEVMRLAIKALSEPAPNLQDLMLVNYESNTTPLVSSHEFLAGQTPSRLHWIHLESPNLEWPVHLLTGLKEITLSWKPREAGSIPTTEQLQDVLVECPELEQLTICNMRFRPPYRSSLFHLPRLLRCHLIGLNPKSLSSIILYVNAPALQYLSLEQKEEESDGMGQYWPSKLPTFPKLQTLHLRFNSYSPVPIRHLLHNMPKVQELALHQFHHIQDVLEAMTVQTTPLFPYLTQLTVEGPFPIDLLLQVLRIRSENEGGNLKKVEGLVFVPRELPGTREFRLDDAHIVLLGTLVEMFDCPFQYRPRSEHKGGPEMAEGVDGEEGSGDDSTDDGEDAEDD